MPAPRLPQDLPSVEYLRECLAYNPDTGVLTWKERPREHFSSSGAHACFLSRRAGFPAGNLSGVGYLMIGLDGSQHLAHRVAWAVHHGAWPDQQLDHINLVKDDNRIANLRDVSRATNSRGLVKSRASTSGFTGISWHRKTGKWRAQVMFKGKGYHLGLYSDISDAVAARKAANLRFGFSENHGQVNQCKVLSERSGRLRKDSLSGHPGVYRSKAGGRWRARIGIEKKVLSLGTFETKEEAIAARKAAEIQYGVADRVSYGSGPAILQDPPT